MGRKITSNSCIPALHECLGIDWDDCHALRRIAMTLHRWFELECGDDNGWASVCLTRGLDSCYSRGVAVYK